MRVEHRVAAMAARIALLTYADMVLSPEQEEEMVGIIQKEFSDNVLREMERQDKERNRYGRRQGKRRSTQG